MFNEEVNFVTKGEFEKGTSSYYEILGFVDEKESGVADVVYKYRFSLGSHLLDMELFCEALDSIALEMHESEDEVFIRNFQDNIKQYPLIKYFRMGDREVHIEYVSMRPDNLEVVLTLSLPNYSERCFETFSAEELIGIFTM